MKTYAMLLKKLGVRIRKDTVIQAVKTADKIPFKNAQNLLNLIHLLSPS